MRLTDIRFGVSHLEDGTPVLLPFGLFGRTVYRFNETLNARYKWVMRVAIAIGAVIFIYLTYSYASGALSYSTVFEAAVVSGVLWDVARILCVRAVSWGVPTLSITPSRKYPDFDFFSSSLLMTFPATIGLFASVEFFMMYGLLHDLATHQNKFALFSPWVMLAHAGTYCAYFLRANGTR
jgi:hypothetical protein